MGSWCKHNAAIPQWWRNKIILHKYIDSNMIWCVGKKMQRKKHKTANEKQTALNKRMTMMKIYSQRCLPFKQLIKFFFLVGKKATLFIVSHLFGESRQGRRQLTWGLTDSATAETERVLQTESRAFQEKPYTLCE